MAATYEAWGPQIKHLCGTDVPNEEEEGLRNLRGSGNVDAEQDNYERGSEDHAVTGGTGISGNGVQVCAFDNRGVGRSSAPTRKQDYTYELFNRTFTYQYFDFFEAQMHLSTPPHKTFTQRCNLFELQGASLT